MSGSKEMRFPKLRQRLYSVWYRHMRVYTKHLFSNGFPPFLEPLIFLWGIGLGLGQFIAPINGQPYLVYLSIGLLVTSAMWTSSFECTFGTFIRMEFEKVYDGMLAAPITAENLILGEMFWAGSKGFFFSLAVLIVVGLFGKLPMPGSLAAPLIGFATAFMFGALGLLVTSFVKTINHFNFYMTGLISPMFFFSGVVFPVESLPKKVQWLAELVPLTHCVRIMRFIAALHWDSVILWDAAYVIVFTLIVGFFATKRLKKRLIT
ncbi:MAG: ABC transporter permease [Planctomycetaceae bacterium]|nr:ABC transporter permease [Planctomycetaceae bacterium]